MARRDEKKDIRNFGLFLAALLSLIGGVGGHKRDFVINDGPWIYLLGAAFVVLICALFIRPALRPVYKGAMWLGMKLNWVMTRVILSVFFFVFLAPIGLLMRLLRKDLVGRKAEANGGSYWKPPKRAEYKPEYTERLY